MERKRFEQFAWGVLLYNLAVIFWGVYVRASFSGDGCGPHWPLCSGQTLSVDAHIKHLVEYSHRISSGICVPLVVVLCVWSNRIYSFGSGVRKGALLSVVFTFSEALLGAALVLFKWVAHNPSASRAFAVSAHLTNTFILLACLTLTAWCASGGSMPVFRNAGKTGHALIVALVAVTILGISGTLAALGDTLYPSSSIIAGMKQDFAPTANYLLKLRPFHPVVAIVVALYIGAIASIIGKRRPYPNVVRFKKYMMWIFVLQMVCGFVNLMLHAPVWLQLFHLLIADMLWIALILFTTSALSENHGERVAIYPENGRSTA